MIGVYRLVPEIPGYLEDLFEPSDNEPLQVQFWGNPEEQFLVKEIMVGSERPGVRPAATRPPGCACSCVTAVAPRLAGSAPYYIFTDRLKLPMVMGAMVHGSGAHAPDEYMVIEPKPGLPIAGLAGVEKYYVDFLYAFAGMSGK